MPDKSKPTKTQPNCFKCRHFFITHEPAHPYGCQAMGFKSMQMPSTTVFANSGIECQLFAAKKSYGSR
jgi:hypothetical protein